ncbi:MAG: hypothetical protein LUH04_10720 [Clostridium sp.]|nr:hypothetical protein [Clostridium sp.]
MASETKKDIGELFRDGDLVRNAIKRGGMEAMKRHIQAGAPMVSWKDGKIVHIPPDELKRMLAEMEAELETP